MKPRALLLWLAAYAIAMALVEAAVVVHLRHVYYPDNPLALFPLGLLGAGDLALELAREIATVVVLLAVALLAARGFVRRFAAFVYVFGLWDLFYYVWLKLYLGWPSQWLERDILFLLPWPWSARHQDDPFACGSLLGLVAPFGPDTAFPHCS